MTEVSAASVASSSSAASHQQMPDCASLPAAVADLVGSAWQCMRYAERVADANLRFSLSHRSALRMAAAVLAAHLPTLGSREPAPPAGTPSVWVLVCRVAPALAEWAGYYSRQTGLKQAAEAGSPVITSRMADDAVREACQFIHDAVTVLGSAAAQRRAPMHTPVGDVAAGWA